MLGLQLYTVRHKMDNKESAYATLKEIKKMGYECVQLASTTENMEMIARICKEIGLSVIGLLVDMKMCEEEGEKLFEIARMCGAEDIGISSSIKTDEQTYDIIKRANTFAKNAKDQGFSFSYHNHSNEFIRGESGKTLMSHLIEGFDHKLIDFMPDTYWLQHGGADVRAFLESIGGRVKILHLKDMKRTLDGPTYAEVGAGNINFEGIINVAKKIGVEHFIVEQDKCDVDSLISAKMSCDYLKSQIFKGE